MQVQLHTGDCRVILKTIQDSSIDAAVTDPPYEIGFMSKKWDKTGVAFDHATWSETLRVLKPGGHLLAFASARTYHRIACAIEDAGFEIRDQILWLYGSGFPKSLDVSKAIDKECGAERVCTKPGVVKRDGYGEDWDTGSSDSRPRYDMPATEAAMRWKGWGTALKPAHEPIVVARKPLIGTVAENIQRHGTGALNIDACRIPHNEKLREGSGAIPARHDQNTPRKASSHGSRDFAMQAGQLDQLGRWPANVIHDGSEEVLAAFPEATGQLARARTDGADQGNNTFGALRHITHNPQPRGDTGSAARFFYCPKACRTERNAGLGGSEDKPLNFSSGEKAPGTFQSTNTRKFAKNNHPTVKPIELMRYLCRLITPPGGTVLDQFVGSGSTGCAALQEGFGFVGIDIDQENISIAEARINYWRGYQPGLLGAV